MAAHQAPSSLGFSRHMLVILCFEEGMATHSSVLAWRIPEDEGAWWAAIYGVVQSQTRLKRLSSSSSRGGTLEKSLFFTKNTSCLRTVKYVFKVSEVLVPRIVYSMKLWFKWRSHATMFFRFARKFFSSWYLTKKVFHHCLGHVIY